MKEPSDADATIVDVALYGWKCVRCQRIRGQHMEREGKLHCNQPNFGPYDMLFTPVDTADFWTTLLRGW